MDPPDVSYAHSGDVAIAYQIVGSGPVDVVFVSRTVKDLVAGSGLKFDDRGEHPLKGIPDTWHVFALVPA